jgi:hypothetical protein
MENDTNFPELNESHEAGHVVAASVLGLPYSYVTVKETVFSDGSTASAHLWSDSPIFLPNSRTIQKPIPDNLHASAWPFAILSLAGIAASIANTPAGQRPFSPVIFRFLAQNDIEIINDIYDAMGLEQAHKSRLISETVELVYAHWKGIRAVIAALLRQHTLQYEDVEKLLADSKSRRSMEQPPQPRAVTLDFVGRSLLSA